MSGTEPLSPGARTGSLTTDTATETAWRIHAALLEWTGKVDAKAAFALTVESAALVAATSLAGPLGELAGTRRLAFLGGAGVVGVAVLLALAAVFPRVKAPEPDGGRTSRDFIFFGHLRHWDPADLDLALREADPLPGMSRQLVTMARVAWRKHRCVQASLSCAVAGSAVLLAAAAAR